MEWDSLVVGYVALVDLELGFRQHLDGLDSDEFGSQGLVEWFFGWKGETNDEMYPESRFEKIHCDQPPDSSFPPTLEDTSPSYHPLHLQFSHPWLTYSLVGMSPSRQLHLSDD